ncbi:hypothetical protein GW17_00040095 [Ensete ventricosum]|nr:hypothetical protein GW17_00040095 [Ensete ventricosum]
MSWVCRSSEDLQPWCIKEIISEEEKIKEGKREKEEGWWWRCKGLDSYVQSCAEAEAMGVDGALRCYFGVRGMPKD